jgi:DNA-binding LacI/PurR family transcriptional regulator
VLHRQGDKLELAEMPKKVTLMFLSERLGLSETAISSVLNNSPLAKTFSARTRKRIFKAAEEYKYKPDYFARYLNQRRSYLIGVLSPDLAESYDAGVLEGIEEYLLQSDYRYFLASHQWSNTRIERTMQMFPERGVDGIINTPPVSAVDLPMAKIGKPDTSHQGVSIIIDNHEGIRSALEHLTSLGHRKIAFFKGHKDSADTEDRWDAFVAAAQRFSIKVDPKLVVQLERLGTQQNSAIEEGARGAEQLFSRHREFTALIAFNDISAIGAINRFRDHGWRIPQDLSVVDFDDAIAARVVISRVHHRATTPATDGRNCCPRSHQRDHSRGEGSAIGSDPTVGRPQLHCNRPRHPPQEPNRPCPDPSIRRETY